MQHNRHYDVDMDLVPTPQFPTHREVVPLKIVLDGIERDLDPLAPEHVAAGFLLEYSGRTRDAYRRDLAHWFGFCERYSIAPLGATRSDVSAYARHLEEVEDRSPSTVARRLSALSGFYRFALDAEIVTRNPVSPVKRPKVGTDTVSTGLDKDELGALIAAAAADGPRSNGLVLLLGMNGLRVSEALQSDVTDLGTERGHRVLKITRKGGKRSTVPLAPRTAEALEAMIDARSEGPLFVTSSGARLDRTGAWRLIRKLAKRAVPDKADSLHPHDLRHAFVTLSLDNGASLRDVQDAAGHADPRTTRRYDRARHNLDKHPTYALAGYVD